MPNRMYVRPSWHAQAACRGAGPSLFYPDKDGPMTDIAAARSICATCPVSGPCAEAGIGELHGIWSGSTVHDRLIRRTARRQMAS